MKSALFMLDWLIIRVELAGGGRVDLKDAGACADIEYSITPADPCDRGSVDVVAIHAARPRIPVMLRSASGEISMVLAARSDILPFLSNFQVDQITEQLAKS